MNVRSVPLSPVFKIAVWSIPATVLVMIPGFTDPINLPKLLALWSIAFIAIFLSVFLQKFERFRVTRKQIRLHILLYISLIASMCLVAIVGSSNFVRAFFGAPGRNNGLIYYVSVISLCLLLLLMPISRPQLQYLRNTIQITSLLFASYCTVQFFSFDPIEWVNPYNRIIGTLGNPNFSASILATFSVFWVYEALRKRKVSSRQFSLSLLTSLWLGLLAWATESLQGMVIIFVGIFIVAFIFLREKFSTRFVPIATLLIGVIGLLIMFLSFIGVGPFGSLLQQYTLKLRFTYASIGIKSMFDSPLYGVGIDNFNSAFRLYRTPEFVSQYGVGLYADNAHSTPAQIGSTFGLIVFVLYLLLHMTIAFKALKVIYARSSALMFEKGIAVIWLLIFLQSLLSIEIIGLGVMNWILGAMLLSLDISRSESEDLVISDRKKSKQRQVVLPAWTGSTIIGLLFVSMIPTAVIAREDSAFKNILAISVQNSAERDWVRTQFSKLSSFTLLEPLKVNQILENMFNAGMEEEIEDVIVNMYDANPTDLAANGLMALHFNRKGKEDSELKVREAISKLDPVNYQLELTLARIYAKKGLMTKLKASVAKIEAIAPISEEAKLARELLETSSINSIGKRR